MRNLPTLVGKSASATLLNWKSCKWLSIVASAPGSAVAQSAGGRRGLQARGVEHYYRSRGAIGRTTSPTLIRMLNLEQLAALLIKVAVSASIASILMRFGAIQKILLREERTVRDRLELAFIF